MFWYPSHLDFKFKFKWEMIYCKIKKSWWFSLGIPVSSSNKTDCHGITEIFLKVLLNTITLTQNFMEVSWHLQILKVADKILGYNTLMGGRGGEAFFSDWPWNLLKSNVYWQLLKVDDKISGYIQCTVKPVLRSHPWD